MVMAVAEVLADVMAKPPPSTEPSPQIYAIPCSPSQTAWSLLLTPSMLMVPVPESSLKPVEMPTPYPLLPLKAPVPLGLDWPRMITFPPPDKMLTLVRMSIALPQYPPR